MTYCTQLLSSISSRMILNFFHPFIFLQHDCQLTGCLNACSCELIEASKVFNCKCKEAWSESYCTGVVFLVEKAGSECGN